MKYRICFLFAMEEEAKPFIDKINAVCIKSAPFKIYRKDSVLIVISGIGSSNASTAITYVNGLYEIDYYVNSGLAGAAGEILKQYDIVLVDKCYFGDVDVTAFNYSYGQIPKGPKFYKSSPEMLEILQDSCGTKIITKNLATTQSFIHSQEMFDSMIGKIKDNIELFDMEAAAFCHTAALLEKPIIVIKAVSDVLNSETSNSVQFDTILERCAQNLADVIWLYSEQFI